MTTDQGSGIGRKIAYYRSRKGLSQRDFAPLIKRSEAWVSQVERGVRPVKALDVLERIAEVLDMPVAELVPSAPVARAARIPQEAVGLRRLLTADHPLRAMITDGPVDFDAQRLAEAVESVWARTRQARYGDLLRLLEQLVPELESAAARDGASRAAELLAEAYAALGIALADLQQFDAAWVAAERAMAKAQRSADPVLVAAGAYHLTLIFQRAQQLAEAEHIASTACAALAEPAGPADPRALCVYGALTLQLAVIAAKTEDADRAHELLHRARELAAELGTDRRDHHTVFGPTTVDLCEVGAAVELGDAGTAIRLAGKVDTDRLPETDHARLLLYVARAWAQRRSPDRALTLLLRAEELAPDQVHNYRSVRSTTTDLLSMDPGTPGLAEFAQRIGIDAALIQPAGRAGNPRGGLRAARGPRAI
ncbi:helix-turn-helix domain-containing protein [Nocardia sp. X0981]